MLAKTSHNGLTPREVQVLTLIAAGFSTKQIAAFLGIAFKTATCHRCRLMEKLGIHEVAGLTRYAIRVGYVAGGPAENSSVETQEQLFEQVQVTYARYQQSLQSYSSFLKDRETFGLENPDASTGARRLRQAEQAAHDEYHAALVRLKKFLIRD